MTPWRNLTLRTAMLGATGAALVAGVVACSSGATQTNSTSASSPAPTSSTSQSATPSDGPTPNGHEAFRQCMTEHGVTMPEHGGKRGHPDGPRPDGATPPDGPPPGAPTDGQAPPAPPGVDQSTWDAAHQACAALAPPPQK